MTREEEILEYSKTFKGKGMENEELKEIIRLAIIDGATWADKHPRKGLIDIERAYEWLTKHARNYYFNKERYLGTEELVEDFKLSMEM